MPGYAGLRVSERAVGQRWTPPSPLQQLARDRSERAQAQVEGLDKLIESGRALFRQPMRTNGEYEQWENDHDSWTDNAEEFIRNHIGHSAAGDFRRGYLIAVQPIDHAFDDSHNGRLSRLSHRLLDLTQRLERTKDDARI